MIAVGACMSFKTCPNCRFLWPDRDSFLSDPALRLVGYQPNFDTLEAGLFLFNHACGTTLAMPAEAFSVLYRGPIFQTRFAGGKKCVGHCQHFDDLAPCPATCECAYVRAILDRVAHWPKAPPLRLSQTPGEVGQQAPRDYPGPQEMGAGRQGDQPRIARIAQEEESRGFARNA